MPAGFTQPLLTRGLKISMDGRGRALDNVFVERLWRTVKYDEVYLKSYGSQIDVAIDRICLQGIAMPHLLHVGLITKFAWIICVLGAFLVVTGGKMIVTRNEEMHSERNPVVRWFKKLMPVTDGFRGDRFFVFEHGRRWATPLFVVLLLVEVSDLSFAVDSIPAIFAVTTGPFIVYTSNVFAILGLRSLYFALAGVMDKFHYLKIGLGVVLVFVGIKMLLAHSPWKIDTLLSLAVIAVVLTVAVVASILRPRSEVPPRAGDLQFRPVGNRVASGNRRSPPPGKIHR